MYTVLVNMKNNRCVYLFCVCLILAFVSGCDRQTRYTLLTTFFTGVPSYEEYYAEKKPAEEKQEQKSEIEQVGVDSTVHPVFEAGLCNSCHKGVSDEQAEAYLAGEGFASSDSSSAAPELLYPKNRLCTSCHNDKTPKRAIKEGFWLHNPVARGACLACHEPHRSDYPDLLRMPKTEVCESCHTGEELEQAHTLENGTIDYAEKCLSCHNVHKGKSEKLLLSDYVESEQPVMMPDR